MTRPPRTILALSTIALGALLLVGCGSAEATSDAADTSTTVTQDAAPTGQALGAEAFAELAAQDGAVVLDVRTPAEFGEGHLDGAVNLDVSDPGFAEAVAGLDPDATYAVYCRSGNRSAQAVTVMQQAGITDLAHLDGGIGAWAAAGGEVVVD